MKKNGFIAVLLISALILAGCSGSAAPAATQSTASGPAEEKITLNGSVSALSLMLALSDGFVAAGNTGVRFDVAASGKNASIDALTSGEAEMAMFEGKLSDVPPGAMGETIAYEAAAVIVNPSAGIKDLAAEQIRAIFTGESGDWADFGGEGKITVVVPKKEDALRQSFEETFSIRDSVNGILKSLVPETAVVSEDVAGDVQKNAGAIGICPLASLESVEDAASIDGVSPSGRTLEDGTYKASRNMLLVAGADVPETVGRFYSWCLSAEGKALMKSTGFIPVE